MIARDDHQPVRAGVRKTCQRRQRRLVPGKHTLQPGQGFRFGAADRQVVVSAIGRDRFPKLKGVAVQDEVVSTAALLGQRLEEQPELRVPPEVLERVPHAGRVMADTHVQVANHGHKPRVGEPVDRCDECSDGEQCGTGDRGDNTTCTHLSNPYGSAASDSRTISSSLRATMWRFA